MIYLLKSALLLALLYGCFALLLSRETFHRFNRLALLCVLLASLVLPAIQLSMKKPDFLCYEQTEATPIVLQEADELQATDVQGEVLTTRSDNGMPLTTILSILYIAGVLVSIIMFLRQLFQFQQEAKAGKRIKDEWGNTIVILDSDMAPYSFFNYIIISATDYEQQRQLILAHEQAHIRLRHSWDLMLLQLVAILQWFNPFVYLLGRDLKAVHEYEADSAVLQLGIDAKRYQLLLVTKAVGNRLQTVVNNLSHHSLKKRITMMHKSNSNRWLMVKGAILPALMALALVAYAKPKSEAVADLATDVPNITTPTFAFMPDDKIYEVVEVNAEFPGGTDACYKWLADHIQYPAEAQKDGIQGRVLVNFVVEQDGSITQAKAVRSPHESLTKEALRVVNAMPKWKPAQNGGKNVSSRFILPISFKLNQPKSFSNDIKK